MDLKFQFSLQPKPVDGMCRTKANCAQQRPSIALSQAGMQFVCEKGACAAPRDSEGRTSGIQTRGNERQICKEKNS